MEDDVVIAQPRIADTLLMGDDAYLLAELSSLLGRRRHYVPVLDGPRMARHDAEAEVTVRNNAAARSKARHFILAGMPDESIAPFRDRLPAKRTFTVTSLAQAFAQGAVRERPTKQRASRGIIALPLLQALREGRQLEFVDVVEEPAASPTRGRRHLVVCEEGNLHAQVIAANYAYAYEADLVLIPEVVGDPADSLLAELYGVYEQRSLSATDAMQGVISELRLLSGLEPGEATSMTFFTAKLPWAFAYPEVPSSHIFYYPQLASLCSTASSAKTNR